MFRTSLGIFDLIIPGIFHEVMLREEDSVLKFQHVPIAQYHFFLMDLLSRDDSSWNINSLAIELCDRVSVQSHIWPYMPSVGSGVCVEGNFIYRHSKFSGFPWLNCSFHFSLAVFWALTSVLHCPLSTSRRAWSS